MRREKWYAIENVHWFKIPLFFSVQLFGRESWVAEPPQMYRTKKNVHRNRIPTETH